MPLDKYIFLNQMQVFLQKHQMQPFPCFNFDIIIFLMDKLAVCSLSGEIPGKFLLLWAIILLNYNETNTRYWHFMMHVSAYNKIQLFTYDTLKNKDSFIYSINVYWVPIMCQVLFYVLGM